MPIFLFSLDRIHASELDEQVSFLKCFFLCHLEQTLCDLVAGNALQSL